MERNPTEYLRYSVERILKDLKDDLVLKKTDRNMSKEEIDSCISEHIGSDVPYQIKSQVHMGTCSWTGGRAHNGTDLLFVVRLCDLKSSKVSDRVRKSADKVISSWRSTLKDLEECDSFLQGLKKECDEAMSSGKMDMTLFERYNESLKRYEKCKKEVEENKDFILSFVSLFE